MVIQRLTSLRCIKHTWLVLENPSQWAHTSLATLVHRYLFLARTLILLRQLIETNRLKDMLWLTAYWANKRIRQILKGQTFTISIGIIDVLTHRAFELACR